eukprot:TRINITY_DN8167_c0_g1_i1.p1 TRINITY_DN8167_c0_g1~~TRINITY_DN8167_c0_g1_i1.p1  ORF type:complete len:317 (-),score=57.13 TRINITY_DN8167_c0_g1_i1:283-1233(-)
MCIRDRATTVCQPYRTSGQAAVREKGLADFVRSNGMAGLEAAQFMAQCAHECANFNTMEEYASGAAYEGRKDLGNTQKGDGVRYKGRGFIQITGRANYRTYGRILGLDLEGNPTLAERPSIAAKVAFQYWISRVRPRVSDFRDTRAVTRRINGGYNGLADRVAKFEIYKRLCGVTASSSGGSSSTAGTAGAPGGSCLGVAGVCGHPAACGATKLVSGKCHGGAENVCCASRPGEPAGACLGVVGVCGVPSACAGTQIRGKCSGGSDNVCCAPGTGSPKGACLGGVKGICGQPGWCAASKLLSGKCSGGSDNVCCRT